MTEFLIRLIAFLGAVGGIVFGRAWGRVEGKSQGKREAERDALENTIGRTERGRDTVREGRDSGNPADRLRNNDGAW